MYLISSHYVRIWCTAVIQYTVYYYVLLILRLLNISNSFLILRCLCVAFSYNKLFFYRALIACLSFKAVLLATLFRGITGKGICAFKNVNILYGEVNVRNSNF